MSTGNWENIIKTAHAPGGYYGCGDGGEIINSANGVTWGQQGTPITDTLTDIHFSPDGSLGIASALNVGQALITPDGGINWLPSSISSAYEPVYGNLSLHCHSVHAFNGSIGFIGTYLGRLLKSTDGGHTFVKVGSSPVAPAYGLYAIDEFHILMSGTGGVAVTADGGTSWTKTLDVGSLAVRDVQYAGGNRVWACGTNSLVWVSDDLGMTWAQMQFPFAMNWQSLSFVDQANGFICGNYNGVPKVVRTTDAGSTWRDETPSSGLWNGIVAVDALNAVVVGMKSTARTVDAGKTWTTTNGGSVISSPDTGITLLTAAPTTSPTTTTTSHTKKNG